MPAVLFADVSGRVELNYSQVTAKTEDAAGASTETKSNSFLHYYHLNLQRVIYPNLTFQAGGVFGQTITKSEDEDTEFKSKATSKSGILDLRLSTQSISSGLGYNRREEKVTSDGETSIPNVMENYSANLSLRPEGLPTADISLLRTYLYDKERVSQDTVNDSLSLSMRYEPYKNLDLRYQTALSVLNDRLQDLEVRRVSHNVNAGYSRQFGKRVSMSTTYNLSRQETETTSAGIGEVLFQVFPFSGLSVISNTPTLVALDLNPALVDGNLAAGSGIDIGRNPSIAGDTVFRNIGLDFINISEVNTIFLWVDRALPASVSKAFTWDIYVSSDNLNWTLFQTVSSAPFGTFENRFEISFNNVKTRFLKVVTRPISAAIVTPPGFDVSSILVTELQTFLKQSAKDVTDKTSQTSHIYDLNVKWNILDNPALSYDFYYWTSATQPANTSRYILSNALNLRHRFSKVFSGAARVAREDSEETTGKRSANVYSALLTATPLPTLLHSLTVSGRFEQTPEGSSNSQAMFLNNRAELYKGLNFLLSGGVSVSSSETDRKTVNTIINSGVTAVPHPAMAVNINYSETHTKQTGGGAEDFSTFVRRGDASISYTPFERVYLFASVGMSAQNDRETNTLQNYVITWAPFPDGDLQFNFSYTETLNSENDGKTRTITPSLRWYLMRNTYLEVSYSIITDKSVIQRSETKTFNSTLSMAL